MDATAADTSLRAAVLGGRLLGAANEAVRTDLLAFLLAPADQALGRWYGDAIPSATREALDRDIVAVDDLIAAQLDAILHHPRMLRLEARWRALFWLITQTDGWIGVRIRVLAIRWNELARDLTRAGREFDQSEMFRKIYEEEFGQAGGEPYGLMVIDHDVSHLPQGTPPVDDVTVLDRLRGIAAAAFVPMVLGAAPRLLGLESFEDLQRLPDLATTFTQTEYAAWNALMGRRDTEFLAVMLPHVLVRPPWEDDPFHPLPFRYREHAPTTAERVWTTPGFAFAFVAARAFAHYGWPANVRGADVDIDDDGSVWDAGGIVSNLPVEWFRTDPEGVWPRLPLQIVLTEHQERDLVNAGLMPVSTLPFSTELLFGVAPSLRRPETHIGPDAAVADANARLASQINAVLCASRFAHCLKVMARDMLGSVQTPDMIQRRLQAWLTEYVNGSQSDDPDLQARYPLQEGVVEIRERPGMPGSFACKMYLKPHYQLNGVGALFSLDTEIAPIAA